MKTDRNTLKRAAYQYLLDHSINTPKGIAVSFLLPKETDFYRKLKARETGKFIRHNEETVRKDYHDYLLNIQIQASYSRRLAKAKKNGSLYLRLLIRLKERLNRYINKRI